MHRREPSPPWRHGRAGVVARASLFLGTTLAVSWLPLALLLATTADHTADGLSMVLWVAAGAGPMVAALLAAAVIDRAAGVRHLLAGLRRRRLGRWYLVLLAPLPVALVAVGVVLATTEVAAAPAGLGHWLLLPAFLASGVLFGGLEEIGWRGYLQPVLQLRWSAATTSVVIGLVWALWHAPLFLLAATSQAQASRTAFVVQAIALSFVLAWVVNSTGGSTLLAVLLHGAVNGWYGLVLQGIAPAAIGGFTVVTTLATVAVALGVTWRHGGRDLAAQPRATWPPGARAPVPARIPRRPG